MQRRADVRRRTITVAAGGLGLSILALVDTLRPGRLRLGAGRAPASGMPGSSDSLDDFGVAPAFGLTDHLGRPVDSDQFRGKVVVADFVYTTCQGTCPLLSERMQTLQERLRMDGLLGGQVQLLSFTVDPAHDTPEVLRAYAEQQGADPDAWRFLTGPERYLVPLIVQGFRLGVQPIPVRATDQIGQMTAQVSERAQAADAAGGYDVLHSNRLVLIDSRGRIRAYRDALELDPDRLMGDVRRLLRS